MLRLKDQGFLSPPVQKHLASLPQLPGCKDLRRPSPETVEHRGILDSPLRFERFNYSIDGVQGSSCGFWNCSLQVSSESSTISQRSSSGTLAIVQWRATKKWTGTKTRQFFIKGHRKQDYIKSWHYYNCTSLSFSIFHKPTDAVKGWCALALLYSWQCRCSCTFYCFCIKKNAATFATWILG